MEAMKPHAIMLQVRLSHATTSQWSVRSALAVRIHALVPLGKNLRLSSRPRSVA